MEEAADECSADGEGWEEEERVRRRADTAVEVGAVADTVGLLRAESDY